MRLLYRRNVSIFAITRSRTISSRIDCELLSRPGRRKRPRPYAGGYSFDCQNSKGYCAGWYNKAIKSRKTDSPGVSELSIRIKTRIETCHETNENVRKRS